MSEDIHQQTETINPGLQQLAGQNALDGSVELGEQANAAAFSVSIYKTGLDNITIPSHIKSEQKLGELSRVVDAMKSLPERLDFKPGITLIVGENGAGKSTLGKALYFAAEFDALFERRKKHAEDKGQTEEECRQDTLEYLFKGTNGFSELRDTAGLAAPIALASMLEGTTFKAPVEPEYVDVGELYGKNIFQSKKASQQTANLVTRTDSQGRTVEVQDGFIAGNLNENQGSARQTIDAYFDRYQDRRDGNGKLYFVDEPETGLSPRRHLNLEGRIEDSFGTEDGSIVIVPTNSVILFGSDLPRIDLDFPERGIHRPSEYPEEVTH